MASIASLSSSWGGIGGYSNPLLLVHYRGYSQSGTALLHIILLAVLGVGPIETRALKSQLLGVSCASDMYLVGPALGRRNALLIWMMAQGVC